MAHPESFFQKNRQQLASELKGGLFVVTAYTEMQRKADQAFQFEQEANFWYLSGIDSPRWKLVYDGIRHHTWLVRPEVDEVERIFNGESDSTELQMKSGADEVIDEADFEPLLRQLTRTHSTVYTVKPLAANAYSFTQNPAQKQLTRVLERIFTAVNDCTETLATLRAIKQPNEIKALEKAISLTMSAFELIHMQLPEASFEYEVEAIATNLFRQKGVMHAYDPIVAAGKNACTLHYTANNQRVNKHQLILCDIGAVYDGYAADITRTYAGSATSQRSLAVLATVADAQSEIIKLIKPGLSFAEYRTESDKCMATALRSLGLSAATDVELVRTYMPHAVSHGLGIDVHDGLGSYRQFQPGMVLTVEPGIYLPAESIGIRIEDDILVTEKGNRVLSKRLASNPAADLLS